MPSKAFIYQEVREREVENPSKRFQNCPSFLRKTPDQRAQMLEKHKACSICLDSTHGKDDCRTNFNSVVSETALDGNTICKEFHSKLVHGSGLPYCQFNVARILPKTSTTKQSKVPKLEVNLIRRLGKMTRLGCSSKMFL